MSRIVNAAQSFFVVTGGPGSGKTTLLAALSAAGSTCMAEAGRQIIRDQVASAGTALPWIDPDAFAELMLARDLRTYRAAQAVTGPVLFDRGIPDIVGYRRLVGLPVPADLEHAARTFRYHRLVFIAPPWADIFTQDEERKQSFEEAKATFQTMREVYTEYGYELIWLPLVSIEARADFVMKAITQCT